MWQITNILLTGQAFRDMIVIKRNKLVTRNVGYLLTWLQVDRLRLVGLG
jgi:hypothetical protein